MTGTMMLTRHDVWRWLVDGTFEERAAQLDDDLEAREMCVQLCREVSLRIASLTLLRESLPAERSELSVAIALALRVPVADRWAVSLMLDGRGDEVEAGVWLQIEPRDDTAAS